MQIRPSTRKFDSTHRDIDVINVARFMPAFINRQIIILLATLGVQDEVCCAVPCAVFVGVEISLERSCGGGAAFDLLNLQLVQLQSPASCHR